MAQRARRTTIRPSSYKTFSETGEVTEATGSEQDRLMAEVMADDRLRSEDDNMQRLDEENIQNLVSLTEHLTPLTPEMSQENEEVDIFVNTDDDDLDGDNYKAKASFTTGIVKIRKTEYHTA